MTKKELEKVQGFINYELGILQTLKKETHKNKWTKNFNSSFSDAKEAVITIIEDNLLKPTKDKKALTRTFNEKDEPKRQKIREIVNESFETFKYKNNEH